MRTAWKRFVLCACMLCMVPAALLCFVFGIPPCYDRTYLAALQDKIERLASTEGKRIVLVGGSGAAFDIRSDLLEQELDGYTPVNFGLYAGLGTTVMLDLAKEYLHEGDVVVFLPEQNEQTLSTYFHAESLLMALDGRYGELFSLPRSYYDDLIGAVPKFAGEKARYWWDGEKPEGDAVYNRDAFNQYGDMACEGRERNMMGYGYDPNTPIRFEEDLCGTDFTGKVNAFYAACRSKGVSFFYTFCPMNAAAVLPDEGERMESFSRALAERLDCPVIGSVQDSLMEAGWFFDTNFHLNTAGQIVYTARLASDLKKALQLEGTVSIPEPDMPVPMTARLADGDNRDAELFAYERAGEGYRITALQPEGKEKETLMIPFRYQGLPVIGFTRDTFQNQEQIVEIVIGGNITLIEDGSFNGCRNLRRIIMQHSAPQTCAVGRGLLEGTNAKIAVPGEYFSAYATNYFWSVYTDRLEKMN